MAEERQYWMLVSSLQNWHITTERGFTVQGVKARHRRKAERMRPGDKFIYYCTGEAAFAGITTVMSEVYEDHTRIWDGGRKTDEVYPYRFAIEADLALDDADLVPAEPLARQMTYAAKWPPEHWTLAFQGNVHNIPESDYALIRHEIERAARGD